jgi:hypothetical protein
MWELRDRLRGDCFSLDHENLIRIMPAKGMTKVILDFLAAVPYGSGFFVAEM